MLPGMRFRHAFLPLVALLAAGGCDSSSSSSSPDDDAPAAATEGYLITVYYTAVESFHAGEKEAVYGCLTRECEFGEDLLGSYPGDFVEAVQEEGTGRITSGVHAGRYLCWSYDVGFWIDDVPADAYGGALSPFHTAAADPAVLARGTRFRLLTPLVQDDGSPLDDASAARFLAAEWEVQDQFTPGLGGELHLDLYIGEEDRPDFTEVSLLYTTLAGARIELR